MPAGSAASLRPGQTPPVTTLDATGPATGTTRRRSSALSVSREATGVGVLIGLALAGALTAIAFAANGGLQLKPVTLVEMAVTAGAGALAAVSIVAAPRRPLYGGVALLLFAALAVLTAASVVWSISPDDSWQEASRTLSYMAAFGAAIGLARLAPRRWAAVVAAVLIVSAIVSLYAIATKVFPASLNPNETYARLRAPFSYWNAVGLMAALGAPGCLWLGARRNGHPALNALAAPLLCTLIVCALLCYSRGSLLALGAGVALWFALVPLRLRGFIVLALGAAGAAGVSAWVFKQHNLSTDGVALAARDSAGHQFGGLLAIVLVVLYAAALAAAFARAARPLSAQVRKRAGLLIVCGVALIPVVGAVELQASSRGLFGSISHTYKQLTSDQVAGPANSPSRLTAASSVRSRYFREAASIFKRHLWLGAGAGAFATARLRFRKSPLTVQHAHSYVMQTLADLGIAGGAISLALLAAWLAASLRTLGRRDEVDRALDAERTGLLVLVAVVVTFGVHSAIDWTWFIPGTALPAIIAAGWVAGRGPLRAARPAAAAPWRATPLRVAAATLVLVATGASVWEIWQPLRSSDAGNAALTALTTGHVTAARQLAMAAAGRDPYATAPWYTLATIDTGDGRLQAAEDDLASAVRIAPATPIPWERLADFELHERGDPAAALDAARMALYLDPLSSDALGYFLQALREITPTATPTAPTATPGAPTGPSGPTGATGPTGPTAPGTAPRTPGVQRRH